MIHKLSNQLMIVLLCFTVFNTAKAQENNLKADLSFHTLGSTDDVRPMWLVANEWGKFEQFGYSETLLELGADYEVLNNKNVALNIGVRGLLNANVSNSILQEAYVKGKLWFIDFSLGKEQFSPVIINDELSSGMFLMNSNARPVPKVNMGIFDYLPLGFTNDWVEIKGGMSQGWLNDDRIEKGNSASDVLLHEKFAYLRVGGLKLKPYAGLMHSALFGGTRPNGTEIPIDFWATFTAKGSASLGGGEETNAAGAHMGLWDFGFNWDNNFADVHFYWQMPFADASGMRFYNGYNKDYSLGVLLEPKDLKWLQGFSFEVFRTDHQSGYGIPDPLYPVAYNGHPQGSIIWMHEIEDDLDGFMYEVFGETKTGWTEDEVSRYLEVELNEGYAYGGRDDYMNNGSYYNGWIYHGNNMGTPLYHTATKVRKYASPWDEYDQVLFYNNRVNGFHLGASGYILPVLKYRIKTSYTLNKGSYAEEFRGRSSWEETESYFFKSTKRQMYSMLEIDWQTNWLEGFYVKGKIAFDVGQLYNSVGGQLSLVYIPAF
ncbi:capsule assembly Wzi family protein [Carboxylicivirga sp. M1479]|uniref:capsule assembly Wzi family protein n=1 Tax=Carboxylicivirga sp. M1479 TaxID=2594476 RepID=UPI001178750B|nr:capsule assembly Wzi family protein [Carboxylicivirga sp. M1479]TRX72022.1 capsule assembly Wzi family protein [Carboxylicivirga sp. M1479]